MPTTICSPKARSCRNSQHTNLQSAAFGRPVLLPSKETTLKKIVLFLCFCLLPALRAQTVAPSQIKPGTNGQVLTTSGGKTTWGAAGTSPVSSVFGRTGTITAQTGDYNCAQVTSAICALPTLFNQTVQQDGTSLTQRAKLNFINGAAGTVSCVDNPVTSATDCTFTGGASSGITYSIADVSGSRSVNVAYQNTSTNPMIIQGSVQTSGSGTGNILVAQGLTSSSLPFVGPANQATATVSGGDAGFTATIMPGYWYMVQVAGAVTSTVRHWTQITSTGTGGGGGGGSGCVPSGSTNVLLKNGGSGTCVPSSVTDNGTTVSTTEPVTAPSFNGVALSSTGSGSLFLNQAGTYASPLGVSLQTKYMSIECPGYQNADPNLGGGTIANACINALYAAVTPTVAINVVQDKGFSSINGNGIICPAIGNCWLSGNGGGIATTQITNCQISGGVAILTAKNNLTAGQGGTFADMVHCPTLTNVTFTVLSTGLSSTQFEVSASGTVSSGAEAGTFRQVYGTGFFLEGGSRDMFSNGPWGSGSTCDVGAGAISAQGANVGLSSLVLNGNAPNQTNYCFGADFNNINGMVIENVTFFNASKYSIKTSNVSNLFGRGNVFFSTSPGTGTNTDGYHIEGPSSDIHISETYAKVSDDVLALNAIEGYCGPITRVTVDGVTLDNAFNFLRAYNLDTNTCGNGSVPLISKVDINNVNGTALHQFTFGAGATESGTLNPAITDIHVNNFTATSSNNAITPILVQDNLGDVSFTNYTLVSPVSGDLIEFGNPATGHQNLGSLTFKNLRIHETTAGNNFTRLWSLGTSGLVGQNISVDGFGVTADPGVTPGSLPTLFDTTSPATINWITATNIDMTNVGSLFGSSPTGYIPSIYAHAYVGTSLMAFDGTSLNLADGTIGAPVPNFSARVISGAELDSSGAVNVGGILGLTTGQAIQFSGTNALYVDNNAIHPYNAGAYAVDWGSTSNPFRNGYFSDVYSGGSGSTNQACTPANGLCTGGGSGFPITLGSTSIAASSTTTAIAGLTLSGPTLSGTVAGTPLASGAWTFGSNLTLQQQTAASSGTTGVSSNTFSIGGNYWTGSASAADSWSLQNVMNGNTNSSLVLSHSGVSSAAFTLGALGSATSSAAPFASIPIQVQATYWNGTLTAADYWSWQNVLGIGATPTSTYTLTHAGSAGAPSVSIPYPLIGAIPSGSTTQGGFAIGTMGFSDTGNFLTLQGSANSYLQEALQNTNSGASASTDIVLNNDQATATTHYIDVGINSSGFSGTGALGAAGNGYLYTASNDLAIGTSTANAIHFVYNMGATDTATMNANGFILPYITTSPSTSPVCPNGTGGALTTTGCSTGGSPAFSSITTGTNTAATMTVGSGASLTTSGTGSINATLLSGLAAVGSQAGVPTGPTSSTSNDAVCYTNTTGGQKDCGFSSVNVALTNAQNVYTRMYLGTVATVASASTIAPTAPFISLTGTTTISTITAPSGTGATTGAQFTFVSTGAVPFTTGGNIATAFTSTAGIPYTCTYMGSTIGFWYCK